MSKVYRAEDSSDFFIRVYIFLYKYGLVSKVVTKENKQKSGNEVKKVK